MYILEDNNRLSSAQKCSFTELNLTERKHLQEWIGAEPSVLGEELLIIQKEFDGFSDTRERLDLLALDKNHRLVIIENKLDDSGRDVTWQAIKYASYCSTLSKQQIITIFSKYLSCSEDEAKQKIQEFLEIDDLLEVGLNEGGNTQRIIFVAANFKKEVTSSVLWLTNFGLDIKCIKVTPFRYNNRVLVDFDQIFPAIDTEEYLIKMAEKTKETTQTSVVVAERDKIRQKFWNTFIEYNSKNNGPYSSNLTSGKDNWVSKGIGISGMDICAYINGQSCRSQIGINFGEGGDKNKAIFDYLFQKKDEIQGLMPNLPLVWERLDDKIMCRIHTDLKESYLLEDKWPEIMEFLLRSSKKMIEVFTKYIPQIKKELIAYSEKKA